MKLVPYLRTSTDDKGQRPDRQLSVIAPWAEREGVELVAAVVDEGTSAHKTNPFERPKFLEACKVAQAIGADGVVVEKADRFTRQGWEAEGWARTELRLRYGLGLYTCEASVSDAASDVNRLRQAIESEFAWKWIENHRARVQSGIAAAKARGVKFGPPEKPLTDAEVVMIKKLRAEGLGDRRIARVVSETRGAYKLVDPRAQRRKGISATLVRKATGRWLPRSERQRVSSPASKVPQAGTQVHPQKAGGDDE